MTLITEETLSPPPYDRADVEAYIRQIAEDQETPPQPQTRAIEKLVIQIFGQIVAEGKGALPLTQKQYETLLSLVDGEYGTFEDPIANSILLRRQRTELLALSENPHSLNLGVPHPADIASMNQQRIIQTLKMAKDKVSEMIGRTRKLGMALLPVNSILENPVKLGLLLSLDSAANRMSNSQAFFSARRQTIRSMTITVKALETYLHSMIDVCRAIRGRPVAATDRLFQSSGGILKKLSTATDPKNFSQAFAEAARHAIAIERAIEKEIAGICLFTKERFDRLHPYLEGLRIEERRELQTPPRGMKEKFWRDGTVDFHTKIRPFVYLIERVQEHLKPYLEGEILPKTENQSRPELRSWLLPMFRTAFPDSALTDDDVELFILSAYLREGLEGFTMGPLYETSRELLQQMKDALRAKDTLERAEEHIEAYTKALKHALRIDFRSMALSDREIEFLATSAAHVEPFLVVPGWREDRRKTPARV